MLHNDTISDSTDKAVNAISAPKNENRLGRRVHWILALLAVIVTVTAGCGTNAPEFPLTAREALVTNHTETVILREGDVVKITFPGAQNLNTTTKIQRDGNITMPLVGQVKATGKKLGDLRDDLLKVYADQIDSKQIDVDLLSSEFPIFVTGAVLRPQKVMSDHPMSVLEAIMECGGFDYTKANLKNVKVLRMNGKNLKSYTVNLKKVMMGVQQEQFYVQPQDIIYIPERFTWF